MFSTQAWAAHYGLPLNTPEDFVQGYVDAMRMDAKGQGKPCGRGFIAPGKKCSAKGAKQLAADLKAGDAKAKARVATGKRNAMAQQKVRQEERKQAKREKIWGSRATPKPDQEYALKSKVDPIGWTPTQTRRTRKIKGRASQTAELIKKGRKGAGQAIRATSIENLKAEAQQRRERAETRAKEEAAKQAKQAEREKIWGSRVEPKPGQEYGVKIPKGGGKARLTRAFKGRSSTRSKLRNPK